MTLQNTISLGFRDLTDTESFLISQLFVLLNRTTVYLNTDACFVEFRNKFYSILCTWLEKILKIIFGQ